MSSIWVTQLDDARVIALIDAKLVRKDKCCVRVVDGSVNLSVGEGLGKRRESMVLCLLWVEKGCEVLEQCEWSVMPSKDC